MRTSSVLSASYCLPAAGAIAVVLAACGSSTTTSTAPSAIPRCGVTLGVSDATVPAGGGTGRVTVTTARECVWTASADVEWLSLNGSASGQGDGSVEYRVASNPDPLIRRGGLRLNDHRAEVTQAAAECVITLRDTSADFPQTGGSGSVEVVASSALCTWTAVSDAAWVTFRSGASGKGTTTLVFDVAPTTGPPRRATITVAGQRFTVTQSPGCRFEVSPLTLAIGAAGGNGTVTVTSTAGCDWSAASEVPWITLASGATGAGTGTVSFAVAATNGPSRSGTLLVAGQRVTITQSQGCAYSIEPTSQSVAAAGGTGTVNVTSGSGCPWTAASPVDWIRVTEGSSGVANGTVRFTVSATTGPARSGTLTIAGRPFTVNQGQGCTFALSAAGSDVPAAGGTRTFDVQTTGGCAWTATSNAPWIAVGSGAAGSGNGTVSLTVAANTGPDRTGTVTAAGRTFSIRQEGGCTYAIAPEQVAADAAGGTATVGVTAATDCAWTTSSNVPWITVVSGTAGAGPGSVQLAVAANTDAQRVGTVAIAGRTLTVTQASGCAFAIVPDPVTVGAGGGPVTLQVATAAGCAWATGSQVPWIAVAPPGSGSGSGNVQIAVEANSGPARAGNLVVGSRTVAVSQDSGCTYALSAPGQSMPAVGGAGSVTMTAGAGCAWTAASQAPWVSITSGGSGAGTGTVQFSVEPNASGAPRAGTITFTIPGQSPVTFTVNQEI